MRAADEIIDEGHFIGKALGEGMNLTLLLTLALTLTLTLTLTLALALALALALTLTRRCLMEEIGLGEIRRLRPGRRRRRRRG